MYESALQSHVSHASQRESTKAELAANYLQGLLRLLTMDMNPYAPPSVIDEPNESIGDTPYVDGEYLVVRSKESLPDRCIFTNQPTSPKDRRRRVLAWAKPFRLVLKKHECVLAYSIGRSHRFRAYQRRAWILLGLSPLAYYVSVWAYLFLAISVVFSPMDKLGVVRSENGLFWISGFQPQYLSNFPTPIKASPCGNMQLPFADSQPTGEQTEL